MYVLTVVNGIRSIEQTNADQYNTKYLELMLLSEEPRRTESDRGGY